MGNSIKIGYRYLWATGEEAKLYLSSDVVQERYQVIVPQIWQDTNPHLPPDLPHQIPSEALPYLQLYPYQLHIPQLYGFCPGENDPEVLTMLLDHAPIDDQGQLLPSLFQVWSQAPAINQIYWLWQLWELWPALSSSGVSATLLNWENIRVQGWCIKILELATGKAQLSDLAAHWEKILPNAAPEIQNPLAEILALLHNQEDDKTVTEHLNRLLLLHSAFQPLRVRVAGMTDMGVKPKLNEDSLFPQPSDFASNGVQPNYLLLDHLAIVCDGIAGHEGGEVASQLAVESIKLQVKGLLAEIALETEIITPQLMAQQIEAIVKVANNLIVSRNDARQRSARQRMGTTVVMALKLPQEVPHPDTGYQNSHELYIAWVGDSRAYWLTPDYCQLLTVDDDMAKREIKAGKTTASHINQRPDATALTQALGIKDGEQLNVNVIRFVIPEDGILLLCSDGLTDFGIVETEGKSWADSIMAGVNSLEAGVKSIVEQAKTRNLDDNITAVASYYQVSAPYPLMVNLEDELMPIDQASTLTPPPEELELATLPTPPEPSMEEEFAQAYLEQQQQLSNPTMDDRLEEELAKIKKTRSPLLKVALISVGLLVIAGLTSLIIQWLMNPKSQTPNGDPNQETLGN